MANNILITPGSANIQFSGSNDSDIKLETLADGAVQFTGESGSLLNISDGYSGSLMSVSDVSGVPIFDVNSDDTVTLGQFSSPIKVLTNASGHTTISGSSTSTGSFGKIEGSVTIPSGKALRTSLIRGGSDVEVDTEGAHLTLTSTDIRLANAQQIEWNNANTRILASHASNYMRFDIGGVSNVLYLTNGQVNIGNSSVPNNSAKLGVTGNINVGNGQSNSIVYFENSGIDMYIQGTSSKLNIGSVGNTQYVSFPAGGAVELHEGSAGSVTARTDADNLVIESSVHSGLSILTPDNQYGNIIFGSPSTNRGANIEYNYSGNIFNIGTFHANGQLAFFTGASNQRMTITSAGKVGIGTNNPGVALLSVRSTTAGASFLYVGDGTPNNDGGWDTNIMLDSNQHSRIRVENTGDNKNLEIYSHTGQNPRIRATDSATALIIGVGGTEVATFGTNPYLNVHGNATVNGNMTVTGTLTAEQFITEYTTQTIIATSGSTKFGNTSDDIHQFTGSVKVVGEVEINHNDGLDVNAGAATLNASHSGGSSILYSGYGLSTATSQTTVSNASKISLQTNGAERVEIKSGGDANFKGWIEGNGQNALYSSTGDGLLLQAPSTTEKIFFRDLNGNVGMTYDAANQKLGIGTATPVQPLTVEGNISGSGNLTIYDKGTSVAAIIRATDTTNGYGLAVEGGGTANTRYNVIFRNAAGSVVYGGISTKSSQAGFWAIGLSPTSTLASTLNINGNVAIGNGYTGTAAPTNGMIVQGNVGIGTTSPDTNLHIHKASAGSVTTNTNSQFTIENNSHASMQFLSPNNANSIIYFGDVDDNDVGYINYVHSTNTMNFQTNTAVRMTISGSGNVGIGTTSPDSKLHIAGGTYNTSLTIQGTGSSSGLKLENSSGTALGYVYAAGTGEIGFLDDDTDWAIRHLTDSSTQFRINNTTYMHLTTTGLAIGNNYTTPAHMLDVKGGTSRFMSTGNSFALYFAGSDGDYDGAIFNDTNQFGMLDGDGNWFLRHQNDSKTEFRINNTIVANITTGGIDTTGTLTLGSEVLNTNFSSSIAGRVATLSAASSGITISNNSNNRVLTGDGTNANAEANLIFTGTKLGVNVNPNKTFQVDINNSATDVTAEGLAGGTAGAGVLIHNTNSTVGSYANLDFRAHDADVRIAVTRTAANAGDMHFVMDNSNAPASMMVIKNDGKVGIGTTSPSFPLSVGNTTNTSRVEIGTSGQTTWQSNVYSVLTVGVSGSHAITQDGSGNSQQWFNVYDTGNKYRAYAGYGGNWMFTASTGTLAFRNTDTTSTAGSQITDLTPKFSIDKIGKVGIGTDAPVEAITIRGTSSGTDGFHYPAIAGYTTTTKLWALEQHFGDEGRLALYHAGNLKVLFRASGSSYINNGATMNFGIGTASPAYKLDVTGTGRFTTDLTVDNRIAINTTPDAFLSLKTDTDGSNAIIALDHDGNALMRLRDSSGAALFNLYDGGVEKITFDADGTSFFNAGNVGIGTNSPQTKLEVDGTGFVAHFGTQNNNNANIKGISIGYHENNSNYRKAAIVQETIGDGAARGHMHFLVDTVSDGNSAVLADAKMTIHGTSGKVGISKTNPVFQLDVGGNGIGLAENEVISWHDGSGNDASSIYADASHNLHIRTTHSSTERLTILAAGNVGIGTNNPGQALEINKSGANLKVISDANVYLSLDTTQTNGDEWHIFNANSGATSTLQFKNVDQSKVVMLMDETGNVGIGTASPNRPLHVYQGTVGDKIAVFQTAASGNTQGITIGSGTNGNDGQGLHIGYGQATDIGYFDAYDWSAGAYQKIGINNFVFVNAQAGLGIGNSSPSHKLDVTGNGRFTGNLIVGGNITAQQFITEYQTETIIETSGSTKFGNTSDDRHDFSGSLAVSGSGGLTVTSAPSNNHLKLVSAGTGGNVAIRFDVEKTATNYVDWQIGAQGIAANAFTIGHSTGNGNLTFDAANTDLTILSSGNVGIGTTGPGQKLHVVGGVQINHSSFATSYGLRLTQTDSGNGGVISTFESQRNTSWTSVVQIGNGANSDNPSLRVRNGNAIFDSNVGIGDTSPSYKLEVNGTLGVHGNSTYNNVNISLYSNSYGSNGLMRFFGTDAAEKFQIGALNGTTAYMYSPSGVGQIIYAGGSPNIWHLASGNVGIGASPSHKLDVSGNGRFTGELHANSGLNVTGTTTFNIDGDSTFSISDAGTNAVFLKTAASDEIYFGSNNTWQLRFDTTGAAVHLNNGIDFIPDTDSSSALGTTSKRWSNIFTDAITSGTLTISGVSNQVHETTALVINGSNLVGTRELGTNAFNSTSFLGATSNAVSATALATSAGITTGPGNGKFIFGSTLTSGTTGIFPTSNNANAIFTLNKHSGNYFTQLGFNNGHDMFIRGFNNRSLTTGQSDTWYKVWTESNMPLSANGTNVGIGTTTIAKRLDVYNTDNAAGRFTRNTASATTGHLSDALVIRGKTGGNMADGFGTMIAFEIHDSAGADNSIGGCGMMRDGADNSGKFFIANNNAGSYSTNVVVDKTGNVGIGATSPATELQIGDYTDSAETITIATSNEGTGRINFYDNNTTEGGSIRVVGASLGSKMHFANRWNSDVDRVTFDLITGNVGIGETSPTYRLDIKGDHAGDGIRLKYNNNTNPALELATYGTDGFYAFFKNNSGTVTAQIRTDGESYFNGGNVGIGITTPRAPLHIVKAGTATTIGEKGSMGLIIGASTGTTGRLGSIGFHYNETADVTPPVSLGYIITSNAGYTKGDLWFATRDATTDSNPTERLRITAAGNVGIGTTSPSAKLHISGGGIITQGSNDTSPVQAILLKTSSASSQGLLGVEGSSAGAFITGTLARATVLASTASGTPLQLGAAGSVGLTMLSSGNVGIGITNPSVALDVSGTIEATADVIAYASSDERLKENIKTIENPIEKVKQIRGVEFDWKEGNEDIHHNKGHDTGLIAQDVEKVVPEIVKDREDGYKGVRYEKLVGLLVESVKEQQKQIEELQSEIKELKDGSSK